MITNSLTPEERFHLIMECRNSGLTDYQWCKQKGISTNTLYRWIHMFRQKCYPNIPEAKVKSQIAPVKQEAVKLDIVADVPIFYLLSLISERKPIESFNFFHEYLFLPTFSFR